MQGPLWAGPQSCIGAGDNNWNSEILRAPGHSKCGFNHLFPGPSKEEHINQACAISPPPCLDLLLDTACFLGLGGTASLVAGRGAADALVPAHASDEERVGTSASNILEDLLS